MTTLPSIEELVNALRQQVTDPTKYALLADMSADTASVAAAALRGRDVTEDLQHLRAQTLNLTAAEAELAAQAVTDWLVRFARALVLSAFPAA